MTDSVPTKRRRRKTVNQPTLITTDRLWQHRLLCLPVLLLLLVILWFASGWLVAEWQYRALEKQRPTLTAEQLLAPPTWMEISKVLEQIDSRGLKDARYSRQKAYLMAQRLDSYSRLKRLDGSVVFDQSEIPVMLAAFAQTAYRQPTWPYGWLDLAYGQLYFGGAQFDYPLFVFALDQSLKYGAKLVPVQTQLAIFSTILVNLLDLDDALASLVINNLNSTLAADSVMAGRILRVLQQQGILDLLCPRLDLPTLHTQVRMACEAIMPAQPAGRSD